MFVTNLVSKERIQVKQEVPPWSLIPEVSRARFLRDKAHRKALKENTPLAWSSFRKLRNKANSIMRRRSILEIYLMTVKEIPGCFGSKLTILVIRRADTKIFVVRLMTLISTF